jgi:hypothetical protein
MAGETTSLKEGERKNELEALIGEALTKPPDSPSVMKGLQDFFSGGFAELDHESMVEATRQALITSDVEKLSLWCEALCPTSADSLSAPRLHLLRALALAAARGDGTADPERLELLRSLAFSWCKYLLMPETSKGTFFLHHYVALQQPKLYSTSRGPTVNEHQLSVLLGHPEPSSASSRWWHRRSDLVTAHLTIPELEFAMVVFKWDREARKPALAWWLREYPALLWRIHAFLLGRYCFALVRPLVAAMKAAGLYRPANRAGELWRLYLRVGGLTLIGLLALIGLSPALSVLARASPPVVLGILAVGWGLSAGLCAIDVFSQNHGVIAGCELAWRRAASVLWRLGAWVGALTVLLYVGLAVGGDLLGDSDPLHELWQAHQTSVRLLTATSLGGLLGCVLQWIWEERAATEPI